MNELLRPSSFRMITQHFFSKSKKFSIVSAVFNAEGYIDDLLDSIVSQKFDLSQVEVILVNDGSTDRTAQKMEIWQKAYPRLIQVIHQPNNGVCDARNVGLGAATGKWITFIDPDDFISRTYLSSVWSKIHQLFGTHLAIMCNVIPYMEKDNEFHDVHPMKYRFKQEMTMRAKDMGEKFHVQVATAFFNRHLIEKHGLRFDNKVIPVFEDGHFSNRLFLLESKRRITYLPEAEYYHRKRKAKNSLANSWMKKKSGFYDSLKYGNLDLIQKSQDELGYVPKFVEYVNLYETLWKFSALKSNTATTIDLTKEETDQFWRLIDTIYKSISVETIEKYKIRNGKENTKVGLLSMLKNTSRTAPRVYLIKQHSCESVIQFRYYSGKNINNDFKAYRNGQEICIQDTQKSDTFLLDRHYFTTNFFNICGDEGDQLSFSIDGKPAMITINGRLKLGKRVLWEDAIKALEEFEIGAND